MSQLWLATTSPGLESTLLEEIRLLGGKKAKIQPGGVEFSASNRSLYHLLFQLRCATRLYLRIDEFRTRDFPELYNKTRRIDWQRLLSPSHRLDLHVYSEKSTLIHTGRIAETVGYAINEAFHEDYHHIPPLIPDINNRPDAADLPLSNFIEQRVVVRINENRCTINLDASGRPLYEHGWRSNQTQAPLRESYAASLLRLANWTPDLPLIDPLCGSGTIPLEAWTIANNLYPGHFRSFNISSWKNFNSTDWPEITLEEIPQKSTRIMGFDISDRAITIAKTNRDAINEAVALIPKNHNQSNEKNGKNHHDIVNVNFHACDVRNLQRPNSDTGLIITNAPYGIRLKEDVNHSIKDLTQTFLERFDGWKLVILLHRDFTPATPGERTHILADFRNGGIPVRVWEIK